MPDVINANTLATAAPNDQPKKLLSCPGIQLSLLPYSPNIKVAKAAHAPTKHWIEVTNYQIRDSKFLFHENLPAPISTNPKALVSMVNLSSSGVQQRKKINTPTELTNVARNVSV